MRIRLEADAVSLILSHVRARTITLLISPVHRAETHANPDLAKREHVQLLLDEIGVGVKVDLAQARYRAEQLHLAGLGPADAAHVAFAELANCDFVTVDDRLLRQLKRVRAKLWFGTPMAYCDRENLR
jgi:predicted nucleic acid-binding protein